MPEITAYCDGACRLKNPGTGSCAFVVYKDGVEFYSAGFFLGEGVTNNFCEYNGLIKLLEWAAAEGITGMLVSSDSQLVVNQTSHVWGVKHGLDALCNTASSLMVAGKHSLRWERGHSGNVGNELADQLCNIVLDSNGVKAPYARGKKKKV